MTDSAKAATVDIDAIRKRLSIATQRPDIKEVLASRYIEDVAALLAANARLSTTLFTAWEALREASSVGLPAKVAAEISEVMEIAYGVLFEENRG